MPSNDVKNENEARKPKADDNNNNKKTVQADDERQLPLRGCFCFLEQDEEGEKLNGQM